MYSFIFQVVALHTSLAFSSFTPSQAAPNAKDENIPALLNHTCQSRDQIIPLAHEDVCYSPLRAESTNIRPWTSENGCIEVQIVTYEGEEEMHKLEKFCSYTDAEFAGRGIALITTPKVAAFLRANNSAFADPQVLEGANIEKNPPYFSKALQGRGIGLIVNRTLQRGDMIFRYTPIIIINKRTFEVSLQDTPARLQLQQEAIQTLSQNTRDSFMALHGQFGGDDPVEDIVNTNTFQVPLGEDDEVHYLLIPQVSASCSFPC